MTVCLFTRVDHQKRVGVYCDHRFVDSELYLGHKQRGYCNTCHAQMLSLSPCVCARARARTHGSLKQPAYTKGVRINLPIDIIRGNTVQTNLRL